MGRSTKLQLMYGVLNCGVLKYGAESAERTEGLMPSQKAAKHERALIGPLDILVFLPSNNETKLNNFVFCSFFCFTTSSSLSNPLPIGPLYYYAKDQSMFHRRKSICNASSQSTTSPQASNVAYPGTWLLVKAKRPSISRIQWGFNYSGSLSSLR